MQKGETDDIWHIVMHPVRRQLLLNLTESKSYASKLAEQLDLNPKLVQFHLSVLEKHGLVEGEFGLEGKLSEGRPVAVKYYVPTKDGRHFADIVKKFIER